MEAIRQLSESSDTFATARRNELAYLIAHDVHRLCPRLAAEAAMPINHWRDAPRKLPSHLAKHSEPNLEWPLKAVGGRELKKDDQVYWGMTAEQAQRRLQERPQARAGTPPMASDGN